MKGEPMTDEDGNVRELTEEELAEFLPAEKVLPSKLIESLLGGDEDSV